MSGKRELQEELEKLQQNVSSLSAEIAKAESQAMQRTCHYRGCRKTFSTDDDRRHYCCPEHYKAENHERTKERNKLRKSIDI